MKKLQCDIKLGGSTSQFLRWHSDNSSAEVFTSSVKDAITYRAKTKPALQARRAACLIGLIYDQFSGDEFMLDCVISAIASLDSKKG